MCVWCGVVWCGVFGVVWCGVVGGGGEGGYTQVGQRVNGVKEKGTMQIWKEYKRMDGGAGSDWV